MSREPEGCDDCPDYPGINRLDRTHYRHRVPLHAELDRPTAPRAKGARRRGVAAATALAVATLSGCVALRVDASPGTRGADATSEVSAPASQADLPTPPSGLALAAVAGLSVKGRAAKTGYDRGLFGPAWRDVDHNGCDTRNDVLRRDLRDDVVKEGTHGCVLLRGTLNDPYTAETISFVRGAGTSTAVQIDHVVPLSDAWQKGAQGWSATKRTAFANDSLNLLAVDGPTNQSKSDSDVATWLPPNKAYRCAYAARIVAVKVAYGAWVTAAERDALMKILLACPAEQLPRRAAFVLAAER